MPTPSEPTADAIRRSEISRFVSSLAGAFRSFYIYAQDNKAFEEILQNLAKRFQDCTAGGSPLALEVTNRSLMYDKEPAGFKEITVHLASQVRNLGYKEIIFTPPLQGRHFFQFLHILSGKDSNESKNEKLGSYVGSGEAKPIQLIPLTANAMAIRLSDDLVSSRLAPLTVSKADGGPGFLEDIAPLTFAALPDFYTWIGVRSKTLPPAVASFLGEIMDATRDGYFAFDRFARLLPLPPALRGQLNAWMPPPADPPPRRAGALGHRYRRSARNAQAPLPPSAMPVVFTSEEVEAHQTWRSTGGIPSVSQDLDLAQALVKDEGPLFLLGLGILLRCMSDRNPVPVQEKALKIGMSLWTKTQHSDEMAALSMMSSLRQALTSPASVSLALFPIRTGTIEDPVFTESARYLVSLGKAVLPPLLAALDAEQDRIMRKKICHLLTLLTRENGAEPLVEMIPKSSPFLLRNIVMILGDIKSPGSIPLLAQHVSHPQKIVRTETIRTLCKIGNEEAARTLLGALGRIADEDNRQMVLDFITAKKLPGALEPLIRFARDTSISAGYRRSLYRAIAALGGPHAKQFLESTLKSGSFMDRFNAEQREDAALVKTLLGRMAP